MDPQEILSAGEGERVIHPGSPIPPDPRRVASGYTGVDRREAERALEGILAREEGEPALPTQRGPAVEPEPRLAEEAGGDRDDVAALVRAETDRLRADFERREREMAARMAMQVDAQQRQIELLTRLSNRADQAAATEDVDPDVSPGKFFGPKLSRVEAEMAALRQELEARDRDRLHGDVRGHVLGLATSAEVLRGRPKIAESIGQRVIQELFDPSNGVQIENWRQEADRRFQAVLSEVSSELPAATPAAEAKGRQVAATVRQSATGIPPGRGSETPAAGSPMPKPNWKDPDARRRWAMGMLADLEARQS